MLKMDLSGIAVLISSSYLTGIALGYQCFPHLRRFYLVYALCINVALIGPLVRPALTSNMTRHFLVCCSLGLVPAANFIFIASWDDVAVVLPHLARLFGCYGIG